MEGLVESLTSAFHSFPAPEKKLGYGTAGFRDNAALPLHSVFVRMGILACFRSMSVGSKPVGVMITASHNPECDNGIKIVDHDGGMLEQSWEPFAESLANSKTLEDFLAVLVSIVKTENILPGSFSKRPIVLYGRDTRPHSLELAQCTKLGIEACYGIAFDMGEVTTPQLHFFVQRQSTQDYESNLSLEVAKLVSDYHATLTRGYLMLKKKNGKDGPLILESDTEIIIDASNGVGSEAVKQTIEVANNHSDITSTASLLAEIRNVAGSGPVNDNCGAEFVQKGQRPPHGVNIDGDAGKLMCSFDGDADRIVFHAFATQDETASAKWILFDGDKIAAVISLLLSQELKAAKLDDTFKIGVVQTAYANGASTLFFEQNAIPVTFAKTGVKYLHHKAQEFDLGIYFEANGHGTVLLSKPFLDALSSWQAPEAVPGHDAPREVVAMNRLQACALVINQAVGDAISDMLLSLAALEILGLDMRSWNALYQDLPSKMIKLPVGDKSSIVCTEDEKHTVSPSGLQAALDIVMASVSLGRCFVRPSGTEDVVRVYAEAATAAEVEVLIAASVEAIKSFVP